ncbi:hypothetical protein NL676_012467 [Syzygium grande]|nr:hypothetical protein NL676_012467 [Syzygium grande]
MALHELLLRPPVADAGVESIPLLLDFEFPPYDAIEPRRTSVLRFDSLVKKLEGDLEELERTAEPSWSTLVPSSVPLSRVLRERRGRAEKVKFDLRLEQSEPIHSAFNEALESHSIMRPTKRLTESPDWKILTDARKRVVKNQIRKGVLNGVALKDAKREEFNKIEQQL